LAHPLRVVVVANKADLLRTDLGRDADARLDFVQFWLRKTCVALNASLIYVSATSGQNLGAFKAMVLGKGAAVEAKFNGRNDVVVPCGQDAPCLYEVLLHGGPHAPDTSIDAVIARPPVAAPVAMQGEEVLDMPHFIARLKTLQESHQPSPDKRPPRAPPAAAAAQESVIGDDAKQAPAGDDVEQFFQGLLSS
jgi:hypothetical protein